MSTPPTPQNTPPPLPGAGGQGTGPGQGPGPLGKATAAAVLGLRTPLDDPTPAPVPGEPPMSPIARYLRDQAQWKERLERQRAELAGHFHKALVKLADDYRALRESGADIEVDFHDPAYAEPLRVLGLEPTGPAPHRSGRETYGSSRKWHDQIRALVGTDREIRASAINAMLISMGNATPAQARNGFSSYAKRMLARGEWAKTGTRGHYRRVKP